MLGALLDGGVEALVLELVTQAHEAHAHGEGGRGVAVSADVVGANAGREEGVVLDVDADGVGGRAAGLLRAVVAGPGRGGRLLHEALAEGVLGRRVAVAGDVVRAHAGRQERVLLDERSDAVVRHAHVRVLERLVRVVGARPRHVGVHDGLQVLRYGVLGVRGAVAADVVRAHTRRDERVVCDVRADCVLGHAPECRHMLVVHFVRPGPRVVLVRVEIHACSLLCRPAAIDVHAPLVWLSFHHDR